jgi:DNA-directed RNA polymerase subunit RPC12/RpoP
MTCCECGYSLIGLSLVKSSAEPTVICPECGHRIVLREMGITEAGIDPTLLAKT